MPFTHWKCKDCGASGAVRHERAVEPRVPEWIGGQHRIKSPECHAAHQRKMAAAELARRACMPETVRLSARDKHILITARVKRKLMADALRTLRADDRVKCRANWVETKRARKGYAAT